ncbi:MAG: dipeptide epimerase [Paracoccus denitrificans]|nr:MAG: dipeptide epimerase [Paracoccus denitrificans]PZO85854.1 MAG: dipeptide epimerase [Paracoccus denitrificans]
MITTEVLRFPFEGAFVIARGARTEVPVIEVRVTRDGITGRAETVPYPRYGESLESVAEQIAGLPADIDRAALQDALPAGAARNGVDCALWDWQAKATGRPVHELAGLPAPQVLETAFTLSLGTPDDMRAKAAQNAHRPLLKIKLGTPDDMPRLRAVRDGAPRSRLIVDANEGWDVATYTALAPELSALGVALVEQPLPAGQDEALRGIDRPVPLCADESAHDRHGLAALAGKYDVINIKLEKTGGLTEALALRDAARQAGFGIMVGCMAASSLSMAPAILVAQGADFVDLDGPLLLAHDRDHGLRYDGSLVYPATSDLWG